MMDKKYLRQVMNPKTGLFLLLDRKAGKILKHKSTPGPYKNIRIIGVDV